MSAPENMEDLRRPWAIIMVTVAYAPHEDLDIRPMITNLMCPTDEYAINDFRSCCRMQINLVIIPPHRANIEKDILRGVRVNGIIRWRRNMPYPPNFRRTAARIIDPATGASTWALGSHR